MAEIIQESKSLSDCSLTVALYFRLHNTKKAKGPNKSGIYWVTETFNTFSHTLFNLAQTRNPQRILFCTLVMSYAHICCVSCTALSEASTSKPYQGVRVKDPVKELLRRKRGNAARTIPPSAVGTRAHVHAHTLNKTRFWLWKLSFNIISFVIRSSPSLFCFFVVLHLIHPVHNGDIQIWDWKRLLWKKRGPQALKMANCLVGVI